MPGKMEQDERRQGEGARFGSRCGCSRQWKAHLSYKALGPKFSVSPPLILAGYRHIDALSQVKRVYGTSVVHQFYLLQLTDAHSVLSFTRVPSAITNRACRSHQISRSR